MMKTMTVKAHVTIVNTLLRVLLSLTCFAAKSIGEEVLSAKATAGDASARNCGNDIPSTLVLARLSSTPRCTIIVRRASRWYLCRFCVTAVSVEKAQLVCVFMPCKTTVRILVAWFCWSWMRF